MSSTRNTGLGVMTTLRQIVGNLDAQRHQLDEALARDGVKAASTDLEAVFSDIAKAREHLVIAHNSLRDIVSPIDMRRETRR